MKYHQRHRDDGYYCTQGSSLPPAFSGWASVRLTHHCDERDNDREDNGVALYRPDASKVLVLEMGGKCRTGGMRVTNSSVISRVPTVASSSFDPSVDTSTTATDASVARFVLEGYSWYGTFLIPACN